ncbi:MAG: LytR C-terminal domain-containing protein [Ignavibacteriaceae bacterium]|nr:MAG: LytR family transcriptional regulator [Chlorobiota bacterium]MBV6397868.1 hypothetical protein [Ignavibacteria bacterium]MCC6886815.1 LytR C-terminal domain-containing protein [Ignavibacteriales bacterium]MCE7953939.1 LytR family transcriptional regulator [Chlorobi bacterium CHB7]MEB2330636.1 LytR C-terminal domain-containing protein [Ignavibacteriaceae bacterium]RIK47544.1 MAG: hypothetical protein DCC60_10330 [Ignavibacteriota bacterium]
MSKIKSTTINYIVNISIILLLVLCVYLIYSLFNKSPEVQPPPETISQIPDSNNQNQSGRKLQIDVRNASGVNGVASKFTDYLRQNGFDVVEMGNFETSDEDVTIILDRKGNNKKTLGKISSALGISEKNIVEEIDKSLYLDATVVIGKDFNELKPFTESK